MLLEGWGRGNPRKTEGSTVVEGKGKKKKKKRQHCIGAAIELTDHGQRRSLL